MAEHKVSEAYIIVKTNQFHGKVTLHGLLSEKNVEISVTNCMLSNPLYIRHDASLFQSIEIASSFVGESIPILKHDTKQMIGIINEADLFQSYLSTQSKVIDLEKK